MIISDEVDTYLWGVTLVQLQYFSFPQLLEVKRPEHLSDSIFGQTKYSLGWRFINTNNNIDSNNNDNI